MGVNHIILTNAAKVQADYFGSHLLRPPQKNMREALKSGLEQAGDVSLPKVPCAIVLYLLCVIRYLPASVAGGDVARAYRCTWRKD
jgi:16S rRNA U1498 N3-methylase RsmE